MRLTKRSTPIIIRNEGDLKRQAADAPIYQGISMRFG